MNTRKRQFRLFMSEARLVRFAGTQEQPRPQEQPNPNEQQNVHLDLQQTSGQEVQNVSQSVGSAIRVGGLWGAVGALISVLTRRGYQVPPVLERTSSNATQNNVPTGQDDADAGPTYQAGDFVVQGKPQRVQDFVPGAKPPSSGNPPEGGQKPPQVGYVMPFNPDQQQPTRPSTIVRPPQQQQTVTESAETFRPGALILDAQGVLWERTATNWTPLLEDNGMRGETRNDSQFASMIRLPPEEQTRLRAAVTNRTQRHTTVLDAQGQEWYFLHAGQGHLLSPRYDALSVTKNDPAGGSMFLQARVNETEQLTFLDWRGPVRFGGQLLGQAMDAKMTVQGYEVSRTRYGPKVVAGPDAVVPPPEFYVLGKRVALTVRDAATETVEMGDISPIELGKSGYASPRPSEAALEIPGPTGETLTLASGARGKIENQYYSVERSSYGTITIVAKAMMPTGQKARITAKGANSVTKEFEIIPVRPRLSLPSTLNQGEQYNIGSVEPPTAELQVLSVSGGAAVDIPRGGSVTTPDGVTYERRASYGSATYDWITVTAAENAAVSPPPRTVQFKTGNPKHDITIRPKPATVPVTERPSGTGSPSTTPDVNAPAVIEAEGRRVDRGLADPADYETHSAGIDRVRVPSGTVRILDDGNAVVKDGEGTTGTNRFRGWNFTPTTMGRSPYNNDYIREHSSAQVDSRDASKVTNPRTGTEGRVADTRGRLWEYDGAKWKMVARR